MYDKGRKGVGMVATWDLVNMARLGTVSMNAIVQLVWHALRESRVVFVCWTCCQYLCLLLRTLERTLAILYIRLCLIAHGQVQPDSRQRPECEMLHHCAYLELLLKP